jgi:peptide/nickel transport system permease protein
LDTLSSGRNRSNNQLYSLQLKLSLWRSNLVELFASLRRHPLALLGGIVLLAYIILALLAPNITAYDPNRGSLRARLTPPAWEEGGTWKYPLGTDAQGRDLLTRILYGGRVSLSVGFLSVGISALLGTMLGALCGYFGGWLDNIVSRFADLLLAFPYLIFAIGMMAFLGPGFANLILALTFKSWVEFFRLVRGATLAERTQEYVEAAKVSGQGPLAVIAQEILPNIFHSVFVLATLRMGFLIIMEASLSFLGLGLPARTPAWGSMVAAGRDSLLVAWWVSTLPGIAILILVLAINLFGEGLRDILDPRLKVDG